MNAKLREIVTLPMMTTAAVKACFSYCENLEDIREVIRKIPAAFGEFEILVISEREGYFTIQNSIEQEGEIKSEIVSYDFYNLMEDYYYEFRR